MTIVMLLTQRAQWCSDGWWGSTQNSRIGVSQSSHYLIHPSLSSEKQIRIIFCDCTLDNKHFIMVFCAMWMLTKLISSLKNFTAQTLVPVLSLDFLFQILTAQTIFYQDHWITRTQYLQLLDLCSTLLLPMSHSLLLLTPSHTNTLTWTPIRSLHHPSH